MIDFNPFLLSDDCVFRIAPSPTGELHAGNGYIIAWNNAFKYFF